ncbi:hypothetical protein [Marinicellulosiphila megalodicopiae]|uniref:hypothetical protein n=1 Tax=Marinicellulosiphila megalodicopiae TaxID=2724896 RepID=UPI003BAEDFEC
MLKKIAILLLVVLSGLVAAKVLNLPIPFLNPNPGADSALSKSDASDSNKESNILNFVPSDSVVYFKSDTKLMHAAMKASNVNAMFENLKEEVGSMSESEEKIMDSVITTFLGVFSEQGAIEFGFATDGELAFYMDGLFPVFKISVADQIKVQAKIDALLTQFDQGVDKTELNGQLIQTLNIEDEAKVAFSVTDQYLTVTFAAAEVDSSSIAALVTNQFNDQSVIATGSFSADKLKYGFNDSFAMVVNFEQIASAIVNPQSNKLGQQLVQYVPESQMSFAQVQSAECQADIMSVASAMPRLIAGYSMLNFAENRIESKSSVVLEILNPEVTNILKMFVGHISSNAFSQDSLLSVGAGVDVSNLASALDQLTQLIQTTEFTCMPLAMGKMFLPEVPSELAFFATMAGSVKGLSASIIDVDVDFSQGMPALKTLDAIVTVSTDDAQSLALMAAGNMFVSFDPLNGDGTPSQLQSMFLPPEIELFAAIKNNFLTVYSGDQGKKVANSLVNETLEPNAFLSVAINLGKLWAKEELLQNAIAMSGGMVCDDPSVSEAVEMMTKNHGSESMQFTINDFGIVISDEGNLITSDSGLTICP